MNQVALIGRLTQDPILRETNTQNQKSKFVGFTLAVSEFRAGKEFTNFVPCIAWDNNAENMAKYLHKGSLVGVTGRLSVRSKNENGNYETIVNVNADRVEFLESKSQSANMNQTNQTQNLETEKGPFIEEVEPDIEKIDEIKDSDDSILWD